MAERAIQQLVYTATAAGASAGLIDSGQQVQVVMLVDGHTDYVAFNHVRLGAPTSRKAGMVAPVWIIDPQECQTWTAGAVKINGRSTVPGGKLHWEILRVDGSNAKTAYLDRHRTASAEQPSRAPSALPWTLGPGTYEVRVSQLDGTARPGPPPTPAGFTVKIAVTVLRGPGRPGSRGVTSGPGCRWPARSRPARRWMSAAHDGPAGPSGPGVVSSFVTSRGLMPPSGPTISRISAAPVAAPAVRAGVRHGRPPQRVRRLLVQHDGQRRRRNSAASSGGRQRLRKPQGSIARRACLAAAGRLTATSPAIWLPARPSTARSSVPPATV